MVKKNIPIIVSCDIRFVGLREHAFIRYNVINISFGFKKSVLN